MVELDAGARGILYPTRLPTFHRELVTGPLADFVRWFWIPQWQLAPGRSSRQHIIGFLACNLVVGPEGAEVSGPTTRASHRDLSGTGWAVGALLRPAAVPALIGDPGVMRDSGCKVDEPELTAVVHTMMNGTEPDDIRRAAAITEFSEWLTTRLGKPSEQGLLANRMVEAAESNRDVLSVGDLADHLDVSVRTLQRLAMKFVGVPPAALIRRRRIQDAAEQLRAQPDLNLTQLAHELGYADHAHLTHDWRTTLGFTPTSYRREQVRDGAHRSSRRPPG